MARSFCVIFQPNLKYESNRTSVRGTLTRALLIFHTPYPAEQGC